MSRPSELNPIPYIQVVVLVLVNNLGDVLVTQRNKTTHLVGYWEFPGGKVEKGESHTAALIRECQEELNYIPTKPKKIIEVKHSYPERKVHIHVYYEQNRHAHVSSAEMQTIQWVKPSQLNQMQLPQANQAIVDYLLNSEN